MNALKVSGSITASTNNAAFSGSYDQCTEVGSALGAGTIHVTGKVRASANVSKLKLHSSGSISGKSDITASAKGSVVTAGFGAYSVDTTVSAKVSLPIIGYIVNSGSQTFNLMKGKGKSIFSVDLENYIP